MTPVNKIGQGIASYIDTELIPQLQKNGVERVIVGTVASLVIQKAETIVGGYKDNSLVKMLGIMDEKGDVDIDIITEELKKNIAKEGFVIDIPIVGTLTFHKEDVDKLYKIIMEV